MRTLALLIGGFMISASAMAVDATSGTTTKERTTVQKESKRSTQGDINANDPSSPHRATGKDRAEQRHEMHEERTTQSGKTKEKTKSSSTTTERSTSGSGGTAGMGASGTSSSATPGSSTTTTTTETTRTK